MPNLPVPTQTDVVIQNTTTGAVDYLKFIGDTLVASSLIDYGIGPSWKVVAEGDYNGDGRPDLVVQNQITGFVDFLFLGANADLIGSALSTVSLPRIVGEGNFDFTGGSVPGQVGKTLVSQLPNGQLDFLSFNSAATLLASDLVGNIGVLPRAVGAGASNSAGTGNDFVIAQLADGSIDVLSFSGSAAAESLSFSASFLLSQSAGAPAVSSINPNVGSSATPNQNILDVGGTNREVLQMVGQTSAGQLDGLYFDSGFGGDIANEGKLFASSLLNPSFAGWQVVDGGLVAHTDPFPIVAPNLPVPTQTDMVIQDQTTGVVDYLKFVGTDLVASLAVDYGLGAAWKIVGTGNFNADAFSDLVAQNQSTGQLDFLFLDARAQLIASATSAFVPHVIGEGFFGSVSGQQGPTLVSQLPNGQLDFLAFNSAGQLIASDLLANSVGLPTAVGAGNEGLGASFPQLQALGHVGSVITQLGDGRVDAIGFSGSLGAGNLTVATSFLMPQSAGVGPIRAVNQDFSGGIQRTSLDVLDAAGHEGVQMLTQSASGQVNVAYFDSGYNDAANTGALYAASTINTSFPGSAIVDGGSVVQGLFPIA